RAADDRIGDGQKEKVNCANEEEPTDAGQIISNKVAMRANCFPQGFVVERERDLHRTKRDDQTAHDRALERQVIQHVRNIHEVGKQQRKSHDQSADEHHDAGPFQNVTEPAHAEAKQLAFLKTQSADPGETDSDQVNLNVDAEEIFENKRERVD